MIKQEMLEASSTLKSGFQIAYTMADERCCTTGIHTAMIVRNIGHEWLMTTGGPFFRGLEANEADDTLL